MAVAGLAGIYKMGDPLCARLTGIVINQPDLPHWATGILNWLAMVGAMQDAGGAIGQTYRTLVKEALKGGVVTPYTNVNTGKTTHMSGPAAVYGIYQEFSLAMELEASR